MGLIEDNSDSIAHPIQDEADLEFSGFTMTTDGGKELVDIWYSSPGVSCRTYRCRKAPGQGRASRRGHLTSSEP